MKKLITLLFAFTVLWGAHAKAEMGGTPCPVQLVNLQTLPDDPINSPSGAVSFNFNGSPNGFVAAAIFDAGLNFIDNAFDDGNGNFSFSPLAAGDYIVSYLDFDESCGADVPFTIASGSCGVPVPTISLSGSPFVCDGMLGCSF